MSILGALSASTLAMLGQSTALHQIGTNVSNVSTGGYKRSDIQFQSVLGNQMFHEKDQGGMRPVVHQRIDSQGIVTSSPGSLNLAISGGGFFVTSTDFEATNIVYTRDGSFQQRAVNEISVTDPLSKEVFTTKDGFLVDKNNHFLLGFPANTDGTFPTTGTPVPMRVDKNAFSATGLPTLLAELGLNLDSNADIIDNHLVAITDFNDSGTKASGMETLALDLVDDAGIRRTARLNFTKGDINGWDVSATYQGIGTSQVDTVTFGGTVDENDTYSVRVDGTLITYTALTTDTMAEVTAGLVTAINADPRAGSIVTAAAGATAGTVTLTAVTAGTAFESSSTTDFGKGVSQVDTLTISGTVEANDIYQMTIAGTNVNYTVTGAEGALSGVVTAIVAAINTAGPSNVQASAGAGAGEILLSAIVPGTAFTTTARTLDISSTAQVDTVTIGSLSSTYEVNDIYSVTINGTTVNYPVNGGEGGLGGIRTALRDAINADTTLNTFVTATSGGPAGDIILTAQVPGTVLTTTAAAANVAAGVDDNTAVVANTTLNVIGANLNTAAVVTTTPNVTPTNDNTAATTTTTANDKGLITSAVTRVAFTGDGIAGTVVGGFLTAPANISFSFDYPAVGDQSAGAAAFELDVTGFTQFANSFQFNSYTQDGRENSLIQEIGFSSEGHVVGYFTNGISQKLYKIPLARFSNPNALETGNGMTFFETERSGTPDIQTIDASGIATFIPGALEGSNVNLEDEFTAMIRTQQAYNSSSTAFKTVNEMLETLIKTKR